MTDTTQAVERLEAWLSVSDRGTQHDADIRALIDAVAEAWDAGWYAHEIWDGTDTERANPHRRLGGNL